MSPRLSFVLVVHGEQAYVPGCTASVLEQGFADLELVVVDDASPDHAPALLDELAERDPRVSVRHLPERAGPGAARDLGLQAAAGEYVWFVEATDLLEPGALARVAGQLRADAPDVLLVHHTVAPAIGPARPGPHRKLLARLAEKGPGPLEQRPGAADAAPRAWNKVLRRAFVDGLGVSFEPGELAVTWPALLAADRIAAEPEPAYVRRRPRNVARAGSPFEVFAAYDAVFAFLAEHEDLPPERRRLIAPAMARHQLELLAGVPERDRREFFRRMAASARRHGGAQGRRGALVRRDAYRAFRLLEQAEDRRRAVSRKRAALVRRGERMSHERHYRARLKEPIDPQLAVFAAYWYRGYACNPRAIYECARELVPGMRGVWVVEEGAEMPPGVEHVVAGTREYLDVIARARVLVNNVNWPNELVKREGSVHLMTHHGTPLKHMGLDLRDHPVTGRKMDFAKLMERVRRWDFSVSQNVFSTLVWERVYPGAYESLEVGYPRNDVLVNATEDDIARVRAELGLEPGQTAVLVAPTHREYERGYRPIVDVAALAEGLGPSHVVLARQHYFYKADPQLDHPRVLDVRAHASIEALCLAADVLVTDYSSLMFDYAVLDRPIVAHVPDWDVYRTVRGTYFDLTAEPPGPVTRTHAELVEALASGARGDEERAAFRARFCALEDGRAAERVVRRVWLGERAPAARPGAAPVAR